MRARSPGADTEPAVVDPGREPVGDLARQHLGGGVEAGERLHLVEVAVGEVGQDRVQRLGGASDVEDDAVGVEVLPGERRVDDERRTVQRPGRAEHLAAQGVRDHHVVAYGHLEHQDSPSRSS